MKRISELINSFLPILPYLVVFIFSLFPPSDPDLGWHLKYGEYFWQHGSLLRDNTFSTMMPNYHWANTSWFTDIIAYTTYHLGGLFGLTLLSAAIVTATFYFFSKASGMTLWEKTIVFPIMVYLEKPINSISFRGQQIVLLFIGILFYLLSLYEKRPKLLWLSVPLFWIWVNIDGEFLLGFALFGLWICLYILKKIVEKVFIFEPKKGHPQKWFGFTWKKLRQAFSDESREITMLLWILVACFGVTLINPFGYGLYMDALSHVGNPLLHDIGEYLPFEMYSQGWWNEILVGALLMLGLFFLSFRGKFFQLFPILGGGLVLYLLSLETLRFAWPSYYLLFPLLSLTAIFLRPDNKKATKITSTILLLLFIGVGTWSRYPFTQYVYDNWDAYCNVQVLPCSPASAKFMIDHHYNHNVFSLYGWGGWLIWNYPQIKPTIDGRMHLWVQNGYSAFTAYYSIEQNFTDIDTTPYDVAYMSPQKPVYGRLVELSKMGKWKEVYKDNAAAIFVREDR
ncbi:MAG TPA: hypothetical protein VLF93_07485 [Candidatus Saccharimonadales bacterium]|nr:hypothetical protein [Candidatus Saccharimonadales bacterium]